MNFVVSYPKSGNTWIRLATAAYRLQDADLADLLNFQSENGEISRALRFGDTDHYHFQAVSPLKIKEVDFPVEIQLRPAAMIALEREVSIASTRIPPLVKSHHFYGEINDIPLWHSSWTDRVVNPVRDPREICCSFAAHLGKTYEETAEFMNKTRARTLGDDLNQTQHFFSTWSNHVRGWVDADDFPVCTVRYEDLNAQPVDVFYEVFDFLDFPDLTRRRVRKAVEKTQFDKLQRAEEEHGFVEQSEDQDQFFRSGKTDGWKDELPTDVARKIEEDHGEMMEALGYL